MAAQLLYGFVRSIVFWLQKAGLKQSPKLLLLLLLRMNVIATL